MTIRINDNGKKLLFWFPNILLFNSLGLKIAKRCFKDKDIPDIPPKLLRDIRRISRKMNRIHKKWYLLEAYTSDGSTVKIKL